MSPRARKAPARRWNRLTEEQIEARTDYGPSPALNRQAYDPDERKRLPAGGGWVMVIRPLPPIVGGIDRHVRPGRVFFAQRDPGADEDGFTGDGTYRVVLDTPWGEVKLFPYEYARVEATFVVGCWQSGELLFNPLNIDRARLNDVVFYARSRGIPLASAAVMALGSLNDNVGWFELAPELVEEAEAMSDSTSHGLREVNHQRRAAARARRLQETA